MWHCVQCLGLPGRVVGGEHDGGTSCLFAHLLAQPVGLLAAVHTLPSRAWLPLRPLLLLPAADPPLPTSMLLLRPAALASHSTRAP